MTRIKNMYVTKTICEDIVNANRYVRDYHNGSVPND